MNTPGLPIQIGVASDNVAVRNTLARNRRKRASHIEGRGRVVNRIDKLLPQRGSTELAALPDDAAADAEDPGRRPGLFIGCVEAEDVEFFIRNLDPAG